MKTRTYLSLLVALLVLIGLPTNAQAQTSAVIGVGPRGGVDADNGNLFVGADLRINTQGVLPFILNPTFDYFTGETTVQLGNDAEAQAETFYQFDVNGLFPFGVNNQVFTPYAGVGLALQHSDDFIENPETGVIDDPETEVDEIARLGGTEVGFNGVAGAVFFTGPIQPFVQARVTIAGQTFASAMAGVLLAF